MKCLFCGENLVPKQIEYAVIDGQGNRHILSIEALFCTGDLNYYVSKEVTDQIREIQKRGSIDE